MRGFTIRLLVISLILSLFAITSCDIKGDNPLDSPHSDTPVIHDLRAYPPDPFAGALSLVVVQASNPLDEDLSYDWRCNSGEFLTDTESDSVIWHAPDSSGIAELSVTVENSRGSMLRNVYLLVLERPELAVDGADSLDFGASGQTMTFTIINTGDALDWAVLPPAGDNTTWISGINPSGGRLETNQVQNVDVDVTREGLDGGRYSSWVNLATSSIQLDTLRAVDSVLVQMDVAQLLLSADTLRFGANTIDLEFAIRNLGSGFLVWDILEDVPWLSTHPASDSTTGDATIQMIADRDYLYQPEAVEPILIQTNGGTAGLVATIIKTGPIIYADPLELYFPPELNSATVNISNAGTEHLSWTATSNVEWLTIEPESAETDWEITPIVVFVYRGGLTPGEYNGEITFTSNGGILPIPVTMIAEGPLLKIDPELLDFGTEIQELPLIISNEGTDVVDWEITQMVSWALPSVMSGSTEDVPDTIKVDVNRMGLPVGQYVGTIEFSSNGGIKTVDLSMEVPYALSVAPEVLDFGSTHSALSFSIINDGEQTLNWVVNHTIPWVTSVSPDEGNLSNGSSEVTVGINRLNLPAGHYEQAITITSEPGSQDVTLKMDVAPVLSVNTHSLDFDSDFIERRFWISNTGNGTLVWEMDQHVPWIASITPDHGDVEGNAVEVVVTIDRDLVDSGEYDDVITVSSNGGEAQIEVHCVVPPRGIWLQNDDGQFEGQYTDWAGFWAFSRFVKPEGWVGARLRQVEIITTSGANVAFDIDGFNEFLKNGDFYYPDGEAVNLVNNADQAIGSAIYDVDYTFNNVQFFVALYWTNNHEPALAVDESSADETFCGSYNGEVALPYEDGQFGIRVYVEPIYSVGSGVSPTGVWLDVE